MFKKKLAVLLLAAVQTAVCCTGVFAADSSSGGDMGGSSSSDSSGGMGGSSGGDMGGGDMGGSGGESGGGESSDSSSVEQGTAATTITKDGTYTDTVYTSTSEDENALRIDGATVTLDGITVNKSGGATSDAETGDFYGMNAALLATNGADVTITNSTVTSSVQGGNGIFSYGSGTTVTVSDTTISTTADNSGGIQTTGGGTTNATNPTITTAGSSAAAIRSDRGGGTVTVNKGTYISKGYNSPAVYSTADITVSNATLTAENSEALVVEGENSITLVDCNVYGNMSDTQGTSSDENVHNVMIYQSQSGDADDGTSTFSMTGGMLTSNNGDVFYVTNTYAEIYLSGVTVVNNDSETNLFTITGNSASHGWSTSGSNGANVAMTLDAQTIEGDIEVDTISTLDIELTNGTEFTGTINIVDNAYNGTAVSDSAVVTIDFSSTWSLTGDCCITSLSGDGTVDYNGYTITLADGTVLSASDDESSEDDSSDTDVTAEITNVDITEGDGVIYVTVAAENTEDSVIIAAGYDEDGVLLDIAVLDGDTAELAGECTYIKVFIWDALSSLTPLCDAYV